MSWERKQNNSVPQAAQAIRDAHFCIVIFCDVDIFKPNGLSIKSFKFFFLELEKNPNYCDLRLTSVKVLWPK